MKQPPKKRKGGISPPKKELIEIEANNLSDREFKVRIIKGYLWTLVRNTRNLVGATSA